MHVFPIFLVLDKVYDDGRDVLRFESREQNLGEKHAAEGHNVDNILASVVWTNSFVVVSAN